MELCCSKAAPGPTEHHRSVTQMQTGSLVPGLFKESTFLLVNTIIYVHVTLYITFYICGILYCITYIFQGIWGQRKWQDAYLSELIVSYNSICECS